MNVCRAKMFPQGYASVCFAQIDIFRYFSFVMLSEAKHLEINYKYS